MKEKLANVYITWASCLRNKTQLWKKKWDWSFTDFKYKPLSLDFYQLYANVPTNIFHLLPGNIPAV